MILLHNYIGNYLVGKFSIFSIFTPIFIYSILFIFRYFNINRIKNALLSLSAQSMHMWFLHGLFFTPDKTLQPMIYCLKYTIIILLFSLFICYTASVFISKITSLPFMHLSSHYKNT